MVKALHATLVILGVLWLIHDLYALQNQSDHETDFYFDEAGNVSIKTSLKNENSDIPYKGRLIPQSAWSKEARYSKAEEEDNIHQPTSSDDSLSDISTWDMLKLLKNILSVLQLLKEDMSTSTYDDNSDEDTFKSKDNVGQEQVVSSPENNQNNQSKTSSLQTLSTDGNPKEITFKQNSSSANISKIPADFTSKDFNSSKSEILQNQTSETTIMLQTTVSPDEKSPDTEYMNNTESEIKPKRTFHTQSEENKPPKETNSNEKEPDKIPKREIAPLNYSESDQEPVKSPFEENFPTNPKNMEEPSFPEKVQTDNRYDIQFTNIPYEISDNSTNVNELKMASFNKNKNVDSSKPTDNSVLKSPAIYQQPNENLETNSSSKLEKYQENPSFKDEKVAYLDRQTENHPQLNSTEIVLLQNSSSFDIENFPSVQQDASAKSTDSDSIQKEKESNSQDQLHTENYDFQADDYTSVQQEDVGYENYSSSEDCDSGDGSDYDDDSDYFDELTTYDNTSNLANNGTNNATQAPLNISVPFMSSSLELVNTSNLANSGTSNATQTPLNISVPFRNSSLVLSPNSRNESVNAEFEQFSGSFNSILEYIYSVSNNPFFLSLRKQNNQTV